MGATNQPRTQPAGYEEEPPESVPQAEEYLVEIGWEKGDLGGWSGEELLAEARSTWSTISGAGPRGGHGGTIRNMATPEWKVYDFLYEEGGAPDAAVHVVVGASAEHAVDVVMRTAEEGPDDAMNVDYVDAADVPSGGEQQAWWYSRAGVRVPSDKVVYRVPERMVVVIEPARETNADALKRSLMPPG